MQQISQPYDNSGFYAALLFMIWPLLAMVSAFKNFRASWAKNIFWVFCGFYGYAYAIGAETSGSDIVRYVARLERLHAMEMSFSGAIEYFANSGEIDVLNIFLTILISLFTDSQAIYTMVYGLIFGYFFSRNVWYVLERLEGKLIPITLLLLLCFLLVNPIWHITGVRMWTAVHVFIYGLLPYLFEGKRKGLFISGLAILVHYSFIVPFIVLLVYTAAGNRLTIYFAFFIASLFVAELDITAFNNFVESYAPEIVQERSQSYRAEHVVERHRTDNPEEAGRWYAEWFGTALNWSIMGYLIVIFVTAKNFLRSHSGWLSLASFTFLFFGVGNIFSSLPSGGRYLVIAHLCALALIILFVQNRPREISMKRFIFASLPALMLYIVVRMRMALYSVSPTALLGNPVIAMFTAGGNISLNDVMRIIL